MSSDGSEIAADVQVDCWPEVERHWGLLCCVLTTVAVLGAIAIGLAVAFAVAHHITATVTAASISRLPLANDTYGVWLTVAVRNPNVALRALLAAPLNGDLRVAGHRFGSAAFRLAHAGMELNAKERIKYHVEAAGTVPAEDLLPLGSMLPVEVVLTGEVTYRPFHRRRHALAAICILKLQPPPPLGATLVAPVFHPIKCVRT